MSRLSLLKLDEYLKKKINPFFYNHPHFCETLFLIAYTVEQFSLIISLLIFSDSVTLIVPIFILFFTGTRHLEKIGEGARREKLNEENISLKAREEFEKEAKEKEAGEKQLNNKKYLYELKKYLRKKNN